MDNTQITTEFLTTIFDWLIPFAIKMLISSVLLFVSFKIVNAIARKIAGTGESGKLDKTIAKTFAYIFKPVAKSVIVLCLIGFVGIDTSGFAALLVSVGAGIGLALNGALSNLAGGILIILTRPFRVDDFIEAQGYSGTVEDIHVTTTKIRTPDNKVVYIPNGPLSADTIVNYSVKDTRRVDFTFAIGYDEDFDRAKQIVMEIFASHELVLTDPEPMARISEHSESSINITARAWVKSADYWTVKFDIMEAVKRAFDMAGIEIPYNQLDVHIKE